MLTHSRTGTIIILVSTLAMLLIRFPAGISGNFAATPCSCLSSCYLSPVDPPFAAVTLVLSILRAEGRSICATASADVFVAPG